MILYKASKLADGVLELLIPHCKDGFCRIAGSVRREKEEVGDIEIVVIPKTKEISNGLFDTSIVPIASFIDTINQWEKISGAPTGRQTKRKYLIGDGDYIQLDIYIPQPLDYFRMYAIRTGSAMYSAKVIATAWVKLGWRGTDDGLRKENECIKKGDKWICIANNPTKPPIWENERDFFSFLQVPYLEPNKRNL